MNRAVSALFEVSTQYISHCAGLGVRENWCAGVVDLILLRGSHTSVVPGLQFRRPLPCIVTMSQHYFTDAR